jgi:hypothetical protein
MGSTALVRYNPGLALLQASFHLTSGLTINIDLI